MLPDSLLLPLQEGIANHVGGEVIARSDDVIGRVYLYEGLVAWVTCSNVRQRLKDVLITAGGLREEDLTEVVREAQKSGTHFGETLVSWGLLDQDQLRRCLLLHNARHLSGLAGLPAGARALFVPQERRYSRAFLFPLQELLDAANQASPFDAGANGEAENGAGTAAGPPSPPPGPPKVAPAAVLATFPGRAAPAPAVHAGFVAGPDNLVPELKQAFESIPSAAWVGVYDLRRRWVTAVQPLGGLDAAAQSELGECLSSYLFSPGIERLEVAYATARLARPPFLRRAIAMTDDSCVVVHRLPGSETIVLVAVCQEMRNLGLALSKARSELERLEGTPAVQALASQEG